MRERLRVQLPRVYLKTLEAIHKRVKKTKGIWKQKVEIVKIPISSLTAIQSTVDEGTVVRYTHLIDYPAITVVKISHKLILWDGHHRVHALLRRGLTHVQAEIFEAEK